MITLLIVAVVIIAIGAIAFVVMGRRETAPVASRPSDDFEEGVVSEPVPISATAVRAALHDVRDGGIDRIAQAPTAAGMSASTSGVTASAPAAPAPAAARWGP